MVLTNSIIKAQVLCTIAYSAQFEYPLSLEELQERLISISALLELYRFHDFSFFSSDFISALERIEQQTCGRNLEDLKKHNPSIQKILAVLYTLVNEGTLISSEKSPKPSGKSAFFTIHGMKKNFQLRRKREKIFRERRPDIEQLISVIANDSTILALGITGSLAMKNPTAKSDDIDVLVITKKNSLWLSRLKTLWKSIQVGKKTLPHEGYPDSWCFNLWLDNGFFYLPPAKISVYSAYELCQVHWLYQRNRGIIEKVYQQNRWISRYVPLLLDSVQRELELSDDLMRNNHGGANSSDEKQSFLSALFNSVLFFLQKVYLQTRVGIPGKNISIHAAFLHKDSSQSQVYQRWKNLVQSLYE